MKRKKGVTNSTLRESIVASAEETFLSLEQWLTIALEHSSL